MDAMYRLDAIYPELRENDNAFASLIAIVWLFLVDNRAPSGRHQNTQAPV